MVSGSPRTASPSRGNSCDRRSRRWLTGGGRDSPGYLSGRTGRRSSSQCALDADFPSSISLQTDGLQLRVGRGAKMAGGYGAGVRWSRRAGPTPAQPNAHPNKMTKVMILDTIIAARVSRMLEMICRRLAPARQSSHPANAATTATRRNPKRSSSGPTNDETPRNDPAMRATRCAVRSRGALPVIGVRGSTCEPCALPRVSRFRCAARPTPHSQCQLAPAAATTPTCAPDAGAAPGSVEVHARRDPRARRRSYPLSRGEQRSCKTGTNRTTPHRMVEPTAWLLALIRARMRQTPSRSSRARGS